MVANESDGQDEGPPRPGRPRIWLLLPLLLLPAKILVDHHSTDDRFLSFVRFGENFADAALPEVRELAPPLFPQAGYDGQFYAQMAIRPSLRDPALADALDNPTYRTRRIGMPALAYLIGLGRPSRVLVVYALLNFAFWLLLLAIVAQFLGLRTRRDLLLAIAMLWGGGTVRSLDAALLDFPAAVLALLAVVASSRTILPSVLFGFAALVKETTVLTTFSLPEFASPGRIDVRFAFRLLVFVLAPIALWAAYAQYLVGATPGLPGIGWPLGGVVEKMLENARRLASPDRKFPYVLASTLCVVSCASQAVYLFARLRPDSRWWRFGIGFALLAIFTNAAVWTDDNAYPRVLLPLSFAFNILLHELETGRRYRVWYMIGNGGLFWPALHCFLR